jgi:hypothetical protein
MMIRTIRQYVLYELIRFLSKQQSAGQRDMYQCHANEHLNMDGWEICVSGTSTREKYPVQVPECEYHQSTVFCYVRCVYMAVKGR